MRLEDRDAGPDVSDADELAAELEVVARITNATTREPWEVYDVRGNTSGVYYCVNVKTKGGLIAPVTVKHSTRHDRLVCLTCLTNTCVHTRFIAEWTAAHPTESKAS